MGVSSSSEPEESSGALWTTTASEEEEEDEDEEQIVQEPTVGIKAFSKAKTLCLDVCKREQNSRIRHNAIDAYKDRCFG